MIVSAAARVLASGLVALSCYTLIQRYAPLVPSPAAAWQLLFSMIRDDLSTVATLYSPLPYITELTNATYILLSSVREHTNLTSGISLAIALIVYVAVPSLSHAVVSCVTFVAGAASAVNRSSALAGKLLAAYFRQTIIKPVIVVHLFHI